MQRKDRSAIVDRACKALACVAVVLGISLDAHAQFVQQGPPLALVGMTAQLGRSVALSEDGNTAVTGALGDSNFLGAAFVWTRSGVTWTQQGGKLAGADAIGPAEQGSGVALSADGNTALVGGNNDNMPPGCSGCFVPGATGAVWVWTRSGGVWSQQGSKLLGTGAVGGAGQGTSVALSADGNTALIGGPNDDGGAGAVWVWTRGGGVWTQQGSKLLGTGAVGGAGQGTFVALSADGNTALIGGPNDNSGAGAVWVWTRSGGIWTQQGTKLVGAGATGNANQGTSVALSADGNTAVVGGSKDNSGVGAVWAWTRNAGLWTQQGSKLVGTGAAGAATQGFSVALSADGNTALAGGPKDNANPFGFGAAWVWSRSGGVWIQKGLKLVGDGSLEGFRGWSVALSADGRTALIGGILYQGVSGGAWVFVASAPGDFNFDGKTDILWRNTSSGAVVIWDMSGATVIGGSPLGTVTPDWQIVGTGDYDGDHHTDLLWRHSSGAWEIWFTDKTPGTPPVPLSVIDSAWQIVGTGDYNGDGSADMLWRHTSGALTMWLMNGTQVIGWDGMGVTDPAWQVVGSGDYNGDGRADILWRHSSGALTMWLMNGTQVIGWDGMGVTDPAWQIVGSGDYNGDGRADILWRHSSGALAMWLMNGTQIIGWDGMGVIDPAWVSAGSGDYNGDGRADILWRHTSGVVALWFMNGTQAIQGSTIATVAPAWQIVNVK